MKGKWITIMCDDSINRMHIMNFLVHFYKQRTIFLKFVGVSDVGNRNTNYSLKFLDQGVEAVRQEYVVTTPLFSPREQYWRGIC